MNSEQRPDGRTAACNLLGKQSVGGRIHGAARVVGKGSAEPAARAQQVYRMRRHALLAVPLSGKWGDVFLHELPEAQACLFLRARKLELRSGNLHGHRFSQMTPPRLSGCNLL